MSKHHLVRPVHGTRRPLSAVVLVILATIVLPLVCTSKSTAQKKQKLPAPENVSLDTKDFVLLKCTYYPGTNGKETVPVILLHGWEGQRREYDRLATLLQREGHAVIVPDLRGHGGSTVRKIPGSEDDQEIDRNRMRAADFHQMVRFDLESVKKFLLEKNNERELNIEMLCVVGADMGAVIALSWTVQDWSWPRLPSLKQGQDVKAFVLLSPPASFKGLRTHAVLKDHNVRSLSAMIIVGKKDAKAHSSAKRLYNALKRYHRPDSEDPKERRKKKDLFFLARNTSLQGTKLLAAKGLRVDEAIVAFIERRLVNKQDVYPWTLRKSPLAQ